MGCYTAQIGSQLLTLGTTNQSHLRGSSNPRRNVSRVRLKPDGTRWRTGGEVKGKLANGLGSQYSHTTLERGVSSITTADAHTSAASSQLNWHPRRFKWTCPFRRKTKSGFCVCAITFQTQSNYQSMLYNTSEIWRSHLNCVGNLNHASFYLFRLQSSVT
jgi:hypothetical protein